MFVNELSKPASKLHKDDRHCEVTSPGIGWWGNNKGVEWCTVGSSLTMWWAHVLFHDIQLHCISQNRRQRQLPQKTQIALRSRHNTSQSWTQIFIFNELQQMRDDNRAGSSLPCKVGGSCKVVFVFQKSTKRKSLKVDENAGQGWEKKSENRSNS